MRRTAGLTLKMDTPLLGRHFRKHLHQAMLEKSLVEIKEGKTYTFTMADMKAFADGKYNMQQFMAAKVNK
jgi:hypothetical protein